MKTLAETEVSKSLAGSTIRWTFDDGPTAGATYEHTFHPDGTVEWRDVSALTKEESRDRTNRRLTPETKYASFEVAPDTHLVSYRSESGYTLTVALNFDTHRCFGIASNSKEWFPLSGTLETAR
jgi:hypothetical protein